MIPGSRINVSSYIEVIMHKYVLLPFFLLAFFLSFTLIDTVEAAENNQIYRIRCSYYDLDEGNSKIRLAMDFSIKHEDIYCKESLSLNSDMISGFYRKYEIEATTPENHNLFDSTEIVYNNTLGRIILDTADKKLNIYVKIGENVRTDGINFIWNSNVAYVDLFFEESSKSGNPLLEKPPPENKNTGIQYTTETSKLVLSPNTSESSRNRVGNGLVTVKSHANSFSKLDDNSTKNFLGLTDSEFEKLTNGQYILGARDVLKVKIFFDVSDGEHTVELEGIPIKLDGNIYIPVVGDIRATGLTSDLLALHITEELKNDYLQPFATVDIVQYVGNTVTVIGDTIQMKLPIYKYDRLNDLVLRNSPLMSKNIDMTNIQIKRKNGDKTTYRLEDFIANSDTSENPILFVGDIVYLKPKPFLTVVVIGAVTKPGTYKLPRYTSIFDAIAAAGGASTSGSGYNRSGGAYDNTQADIVQIVRRNRLEYELFKINKYLSGEKDFADIMLEEGDIVYVQSKKRKTEFSWWTLRDFILTISTAVSLYYLIESR